MCEGYPPLRKVLARPFVPFWGFLSFGFDLSMVAARAAVRSGLEPPDLA